MTRPVLVLASLLLAPSISEALPMYAARSGRACANCHDAPNGWHDPPDVLDRKCTLSCVGCHVDPNGGGLRTVSGIYFGEVTLPMWGGGGEAVDPGPTSQPVRPPPSGRRGALAFGSPVGPEAAMAWAEGRYDDLHADPLLRVGGDARIAYWTAANKAFPMQADLEAALHPVHHLTVAAAAGVDRDRSVGVHDLYAMIHELPGMAWLKAGRFTPPFGTRIADHTAYVRRPFGLSQESPAARVHGVELGANPNYPYVTASAFRPLDSRGDPRGWGAALTAGWRDLGWQAGASAIVRRRPLQAGGDDTTVALHWAYNPWFYWKSVPLTWLGEVTAGQGARPLSGTAFQQWAVYQQLAWTVTPGLIARLRYDLHDPDTALALDAIHRPGLGVDFTPVEGVTLSADARVGLPELGGGSADDAWDALAQLHLWF